MEPIAVAGLWAGANLGLMLLLGINASRVRIQEKVPVGTGGNDRLERAVRAHGNNAEYVPGLVICLVMMAVLGEQSLVLHLAGGGLFLARLLHAHGIQVLDKPLPPTRVAGNVVSWAIFIGAAIRLIYLAFNYST